MGGDWEEGGGGDGGGELRFMIKRGRWGAVVVNSRGWCLWDSNFGMFDGAEKKKSGSHEWWREKDTV